MDHDLPDRAHDSGGHPDDHLYRNPALHDSRAGVWRAYVLLGMIDCILTPISADRGICLECDPDGRHPLFLGARRTCTKPAPPPSPEEISRRAAICGQCDESEVPLFQILCSRDRCGCGRTPLVRMVQRMILGTLPPCEKWA